MKIQKTLLAVMLGCSFLGLGAYGTCAEPQQQQQVKQEKPNVYILATGGTIAGSAASNTK